MNFGPTSLSSTSSPPSTFFTSHPSQKSRLSRTRKSHHDLEQFLELSPILKLKLPKKRSNNNNNNNNNKNGTSRGADLVLEELVQSQSQFSPCNNNKNHNNKRPHSTPYSSSFFMQQDIHPTVGSNKIGPSAVPSTVSINKSRLPDITMINKYYGLVPKKFTVHSRHPNGSDSDNLHNYNRKLRAKSAFISKNKSKNSTSLEEVSGNSCSEEDVPTTTWTKNGHRNRTIKDKIIPSRELSESSENHLLLQTRKLPVERQSKLFQFRSRGRSSSLPLSGNERRVLLPSTTPNLNQQRSITINLNSMSWEENCCSSSPDPDESNQCNYEALHNNNGNDTTSSPPPPSSYINAFFNNDSFINVNGLCKQESVIFVEHHNQKSTQGQNEQEAVYNHQKDLTTKIDQVLLIRSESGESSTDNPCTSASNVSLILSSPPEIDHSSKTTPSSTSGSSESEFDMVDTTTTNSDCNTSTESTTTTTTTTDNSNSRRIKLKKTISFDEQILRDCENDATTPSTNITTVKSRATRPATATTALRRISPAINAPPTPPKVLPWTQKAGKGLTLSERRAKLQKSVSIHSTDSSNTTTTTNTTTTSTTSFEECYSEDTTDNTGGWTPPPSAYNKGTPPTKKSSLLFFHPPPEVSTMISQISPIETFEIQVEIEKVAAILNNMQTQNKSFIDLTPQDCDRVGDEEEEDKDEVIRNSVDNLGQFAGPKTINERKLDSTVITSSETNYNSIFLGRDFNHNSLTPKMHEKKQDTDYTGLIRPGSKLVSPPTFSTVLAPKNGVILLSSNPVSTGSTTTATPSLSRDGGSRPPSDPIPPCNALMTSRPPLKKSVSLSCEKELLGTPGPTTINRNEVNLQTARPKTSKPFLLRTSSTPLIRSPSPPPTTTTKASLIKNSSLIQQQSAQSKGKDQRIQSPQNNSNNNNPARKLLLKKALMEINLSAAQLMRNKHHKNNNKLGSFSASSSCSRPKTAPHPSNSNNNDKKQRSPQPVAPLKSSPGALAVTTPGGGGHKPGHSTGTKGIPQSAMGRKTTTTPITPGPTKLTSGPLDTGEQEESGESRETTLAPSRKTLHRQSFSLDEGMLLNFSNKPFDWTSSSNSVDKLETEMESSKKREECLKIYEKMIKTGMSVKLDTIFRGMMTPSEYRVFIKAAEAAAREEFAPSEEMEVGQSNKEVVIIGECSGSSDAGVTFDSDSKFTNA